MYMGYILLIFQKAEECDATVSAGSLLLCVPPTPALHHCLLLVSPSPQSPAETEEESTQEAGEDESQETSRYILYIPTTVACTSTARLSVTVQHTI